MQKFIEVHKSLELSSLQRPGRRGPKAATGVCEEIPPCGGWFGLLGTGKDDPRHQGDAGHDHETEQDEDGGQIHAKPDLDQQEREEDEREGRVPGQEPQTESRSAATKTVHQDAVREDEFGTHRRNPISVGNEPIRPFPGGREPDGFVSWGRRRGIHCRKRAGAELRPVEQTPSNHARQTRLLRGPQNFPQILLKNKMIIY